MPKSPITLRRYYEDAFRTFDRRRSTPEIDISFYPYIGINHTIRVREGRVYVRIAEMCRDMPASAHRALANILVAKLMRKRVPAEAREAYSAVISAPEYRAKATANKRRHGRKVVSSHKGEVYDLERIFDTINAAYFGGSITKPVLTWSARKTYRILGHHDSTLKTIVVSKSLDSVEVPRFIVEYIVFHEMLHIHHPTRIVNGRRYNHTATFRRDEQKFRYFEEAELWIERNVRKLKRNAKRQ